MRLTLLLLLGIPLAFPLRADVFWRFPLRGDAALESFGGTCVHRTDVRLNGAPGTLAVYTVNASASDTENRLTHTLGADASLSAAGAFVSQVEKNRLRRFLVLPSPSEDPACVVLIFDQSLRDAGQAAKGPAAWPEELPALAGTPVFSAVCAETHTSFGVTETTASPQTALQDAAQVLHGSGWAELSEVGTGAFRTFVSGKRICLLLASHAPSSDKTTISVLQRDGAAP